MDLCHLKNSELEPQFQKYKGRVVLRGDIVKDDSGPYAVFAEQASSASQTAKIMVLWRTSNWYSICLFSGKIGGCSKSAQKQFLIRNVQTFGYVFRACSTSPKKGCRFGEKCSYAHRQVDEQPGKKFEKNGDKSAVAILKNTRQLGCVFQDTQPPESSPILWKSFNILKPIRCVQFTKAVLHLANIRDQKPSLGIICPGDLHQRNPNAPKFEDRSQEETEGQERYAREAAWKMARCILKFKEKHKTTFFSPGENWCLPSPSNLKPEEREFVVDSGATMHMISKKDLNSAELETVTTSRSPMTVLTANGEVQTHEEATVHVKELDIFLTMKVLEKTRQQYCRLESFAMKTEILMNGSMVKNHISLKTGFGYDATRRTSFLSWFQACQRVRPPVLISQLQGHLQDRRVIVPHLPSSSSSSPTTATSSDSETREREDRSEVDSSPLQCWW